MGEQILNNKILEQQFSALIKNLHEAVLVENEKREIVLTNTSFCRMFNIQATPEQMIGADCSNAAEESKGFFKDPAQFVNRISELLEHKELVIGDELETVFGTYLERDYVPVYIDEKYAGHMWKYRDVTEKQLLLNDVSLKNEELKEFSYMLSHDIKSPIRGISSLAQWIEDDLMEHDVKIDSVNESLVKIKNKIKLAGGIIEGVINYSRIGLEDSREDFLLDDVLDDLVKSYESDKTKFYLTTEDFKINGAKTQWIQIFSNLISNAIKYCDKDLCEIKIAANDDKILFSDNGPGVSIENQKKMYTAFETLDQNKSSMLSTGIGLAIVKKAVGAQGYSIQVDNEAKQGLSYILKKQ